MPLSQYRARQIFSRAAGVMGFSANSHTTDELAGDEITLEFAAKDPSLTGILYVEAD